MYIYWITKHDEIAKYILTCTKDTIETHCNLCNI